MRPVTHFGPFDGPRFYAQSVHGEACGTVFFPGHRPNSWHVIPWDGLPYDELVIEFGPDGAVFPTLVSTPFSEAMRIASERREEAARWRLTEVVFPQQINQPVLYPLMGKGTQHPMYKKARSEGISS